jgi:hypothetical protein
MDSSSQVSVAFRVYGDNILECENFIAWLREESVSKMRFEEQTGPIDRPIYIFSDQIVKGIKIAFQTCPYFGGTGPTILWPHNPLEGIFDEKTDVVVTRVMEDGNETRPIFAIEFVDALMAGNQGWQRSRRAINAGEAGLTYLYVLPIIGWERDSEGLVLKNPRYLPATVCLAQLTLCSEYGVPSLQVYVPSDWSDYAVSREYTLPEDYKSFGGLDNAIEYTCGLLRASIDPSEYPKAKFSAPLKRILSEMLSVAETYSDFSDSRLPVHVNHPALNPSDRDTVADTYCEALGEDNSVEGRFALHTISEAEFSRDGALFWKDAQKKTCSPRFRNEVLALLNWKESADREYKIRYLRAWNISVGSNLSANQLDQVAASSKRLLPTTYKDNKSEAALVSNREALRSILEAAYPRLDRSVLDWIHSGKKGASSGIFLVPLYAYKPSGDSRPDRGLLPMLKALFPTLVRKDRTLVIVYSKHTPTNWMELMEGKGNELWNSISSIAGALIVDRTESGLVLPSDGTTRPVRQ